MKQYIDKNTIVERIENRIKELQKLYKENEEILYPIQKTAIRLCIDECKVILSFFATIEVKEVDLEKEIDKIWNPRFNLGWDEKSLLSMNHEGFTTFAKYFYELGLKTKENKL